MSAAQRCSVNASLVGPHAVAATVGTEVFGTIQVHSVHRPVVVRRPEVVPSRTDTVAVDLVLVERQQTVRTGRSDTFGPEAVPVGT